MARARNKTDMTPATASTEAEELDAIEAALNGDGDLDINDSRFAEEPDADLDDAALAELDDMTREIATMSAEVEETPVEVDETELASALEAADAVTAAYDEQESEINLADADEVSAAAEKSSKKAKARGPSKAGVMDDPEAFAAAALAAFNGEEITLDAEEGALAGETFMTMMKNISQKKVREKAMGLIETVISGKKPSVYTQIAAKLLIEASTKGENLTVAQIKAAYVAAGYKAGTVNAQAGQMMVLFPAMGMAKASAAKGILEPAPSSVLLDFLADA